MTLNKIFITEIRDELKNHPTQTTDILEKRDLLHLPEPIQKYFEFGGYLGKPRTQNAVITWDNTFLKFRDKWSRIECSQFNSSEEPCRIVYMKSRMYGIIPFEGRDLFRNGRGNMLIKLMKFITIQDVKGFEMDTSALVTVLAELIMLPGYALCDYISWKPIDDFMAQAEINFNGIKASGIFHFKESGEITLFETNDRYQAQKDGSNVKMKWYITADNYKLINGIKYPGFLTANWVTPDGELQYFKGEIKDVDFNIQEI